MCPFGLAACFTALDLLGSSSIPPLLGVDRRHAGHIALPQDVVEAPRQLRDRAQLAPLAFRKRLLGSAFVEDDAHLDEFIDDLADIPRSHGQDRRGQRQAPHITGLLRSVNSAGGHLPFDPRREPRPRQLYVCDRMGDFFESDPSSNFAARYLIERFGPSSTTVTLTLVGSRADLTKFIGLSRPPRCCSRARARAERVDRGEIYEIYQTKLEESIRAMIDEDFHERFTRYVEFNADALRSHGAELADYLAKTANASGTLTLPRSRYQSSSLDEMLDSIVGLDSVKRTIKA